MKAAALKALIAAIPDDAEVWIDGPDCGGYDVGSCPSARITREEGFKDGLGKIIRPQQADEPRLGDYLLGGYGLYEERDAEIPPTFAEHDMATCIVPECTWCLE